MKIGIIGLGYVGLITGVGFASLGNKVFGIDVDEKKVEKINKGESPIYEKDLERKLKEIKENFTATTKIEELKDCEIIFICVGTPSKEDGSIDLKYVKQAAEDISKILDSYKVIVVKSTVIPGTTESLIKILGKKVGRDFGLAMNPEFLKEGSALKDFFEPDRIVVGSYDEKTKEILEELYKDFNCPKIFTNIKTAEMIKYASNSFLATKISFINEIGNICKKLGIDVYDVAEGMGYDKRIGREFLNAGIGFGGSCFLKDMKALIAKAKEIGYDPKLLKEVIEINEKQPLKIIKLLKKHIPNLTGKEIGILGLSFKTETDDIRESRAIPIVGKLLEEKAIVKVYDPKAMENFKKLYPQIKYCSLDEVLNSEAILILTKWKEFENLNYKGKIVIDGRRILKAKEAKIYEGVCW
ncbi:MAG: UDP-glucose 6-dehydrogenase [Candidatus Aenigmatarchaeota archaeon]|nr:MAG: UDP-glucose 6-dehydrogenase [Candidatus Aenigmarchaeota archaeon]